MKLQSIFEITLYWHTEKDLRGTVSVLEIVFVGQCGVFVCLDFVLTFFPLGREAHRSANGASIL